MDMIKARGDQLNRDFEESKFARFTDRYILAEKLGEGQHASVYKCFRRSEPRRTSDISENTLYVSQVPESNFDPHPYAVKVVRDDDKEKILAH